MIKLEAAHIEEVRGIRKLDIDFQKGNVRDFGSERLRQKRRHRCHRVRADRTDRPPHGQRNEGPDGFGTRPPRRQNEISGCGVCRIKGLSSRHREIGDDNPENIGSEKTQNRARRRRRAGGLRGDRRSSGNHAVAPRNPALHPGRADEALGGDPDHSQTR